MKWSAINNYDPEGPMGIAILITAKLRSPSLQLTLRWPNTALIFGLILAMV